MTQEFGKNMKDFKVDFIGIGAQRAGTTWIARCLEDHPQICFSSPKETEFFNKDYNFSRGPDFYSNFFRKYQGGIKGEFCTSYYLDEQTARRIIAAYPDVKILVSLRDPVKRAFSHYQYVKGKGKERAATFEEALRNNSEYLEAGFYYRRLKIFFELFPPENFLVIIYEHSLDNPKEFIRKIYRFLGVDDLYISRYVQEKINASGAVGYKFLFLNRWINKRKVMKEFWLSRKMIELLKLLGMNQVLRALLNWNMRIAQSSAPAENLNERTARELRKTFEPDIAALEKHLGINLNVWRG